MSSQPSPLKSGWAIACAVAGVLTIALLMVSLVADPVFLSLALPVGIAFGWLAGRIYEGKSVAAGLGVRRRE